MYFKMHFWYWFFFYIIWCSYDNFFKYLVIQLSFL